MVPVVQKTLASFRNSDALESIRRRLPADSPVKDALGRLSCRVDGELVFRVFSPSNAQEFLQALGFPTQVPSLPGLPSWFATLNSRLDSDLKKLGPVGLTVVAAMVAVAAAWFVYGKPTPEQFGQFFLGTLAAGFFLFQREFSQKVEFDVDAELLADLDGQRIIQISARFENKGKIRHEMDASRFTFTVRTLEGQPKSRLSEAGAVGLDLKEVYKNSLWLGANWSKTHIEPGVSQTYRTCIVVPSTAQVVQLESRWFYHGRSDWHTAAKVFFWEEPVIQKAQAQVQSVEVKSLKPE